MHRPASYTGHINRFGGHGMRNFRHSTIQRKRTRVQSGRAGLRRNLQNRELLVLASPGLLFVLLFSYLPMYGLVLAFKNFKYNLGILGSPWVGLENFRFLFLTDAAWRITRNTLFLNFLFILSGYTASILIALLLFGLSQKKAVKLYQSVLIFPRLLSWVVVGYMAYGLLNPQYGLLNSMIRQHGLVPVDWYSRPELWPAILVFTSLWKDAGMAAAAGLYQSVVGFLLILGANSLVRRIEPDHSLF